ncbi:MAG: hypothetical protein LBC18_14285 [Opitutaceae bacterium]|jgi:hypothetical protein|nr:hypothetical protein [Opitutaceae bacterium]
MDTNTKTIIEGLGELLADMRLSEMRQREAAKNSGYMLLLARREKKDADFSPFVEAGLSHIDMENGIKFCAEKLEAFINENKDNGKDGGHE